MCLHRLILFCLCIGILSCSKDDSNSSVSPSDMSSGIVQEFPIEYNAQLPTNKLPYPHHNPEYNQQQYDSLVNTLFIINNFGLYQCGDNIEDCYFHDALDFVLENGTPIFALESGTVKANIGGNQFYRTLVIEDEDEPRKGWTYTHVFNFDVNVGDTVSKGQYLGVVNFEGVEHIHLGRMYLKEEGAWINFSDHINVYPDDYFTFVDDTPPLIETPFHYFKNRSDDMFNAENDVVIVSGEVDIVVSMRDAGDYASALYDGFFFGDRLAVRDISYRILKDGEEVYSQTSFDFTKIEFVFHPERWKETQTIYKHHNVLNPDEQNFGSFYSHYIITNARDGLEGRIHPNEDGALSWNTLDLDASGTLKYPNGMYEIEVTVTDSNGNTTTKTDSVIVANN